MERRVLLKLIGGALALPITGRLEDLRRSVDSALHGSVTVHEVGDWECLADGYSGMVGHLPPAHFLPDLLSDLDEVRAGLARSTDDLRPRLVHVCALLSALTAITLQVHLGDTRNAARYWRTALRAVDQAGDHSLQSLLRGRRAVFASYDQEHASSVLALADDAITAADNLPCAGVAAAYAARAQVLARLGQHSEARGALHALSDVFTRLPDSVRSDCMSEWGWAEQRLRFVESHVHSHAGRVDDAVRAQDAALALYSSSYRGPVQIHLHRATCLIVAGDPSEGARHMIRTIAALPIAHRQAAIVRRMAAHALTLVPDQARHLPAVIEARDLLTLPSRG